MSDNVHSEVNELLGSEFIPEDFGLPIADTPNEEKDEFDRLLDEFIAKQLDETTAEQNEIIEAEKNHKPLPEAINDSSQYVGLLYNEERQLFDAYNNFCFAVCSLADQHGIAHPCFEFSAELLYPRFRPSRGRILSQDVSAGWEILLQTQPTRLTSLPVNASDEQLLEFAEKTTDENLQLSIISYVEILIELENCELCYHQRKAKAQKRRIEKEVYEEHQRRKERIQNYIEAIRAQKFPIDAERLVNNYFKTAKKDPENAQKILENNPATYAPIQIDQIPPRFFGMVKPKPEDGIRVNKEIGKYLKNLKV